jgi:hypothetical protein
MSNKQKIYGKGRIEGQFTAIGMKYKIRLRGRR